MREKLTFSCKEDSYKLKLYDQGAAPSLENTVKILSLREATRRELQESKTTEIESVTQLGSKPDHQAMNNPQRGRKSHSRILQSPASPWTEELPSRTHLMQQVQQTGSFSHNLQKRGCSHGEPTS